MGVPKVRILDHSELAVYRIAFESAMRIFAISKLWPREEQYSLTDQIRRASRSVCGNIAEAWRRRRYPAHFVSKLSDSDAEAAETRVWLEFALACQYISENEFSNLQDRYDHICRILTKMMLNSEKWCKKSK